MPSYRLENFLKIDESFWHSIYQKKYLECAYNFALKENFQYIKNYELFINLITCVLGKQIRLPNSLFMLHQVHEDMLALTLRDHRNDDKYLNELQHILYKVSLYSDITIDQIKLNSLISSYLDKSVSDVESTFHSLLNQFIAKIQYRFFERRVSMLFYLLRSNRKVFFMPEVKKIRHFLAKGRLLNSN